jgi:hypothetical protein
MKISKNKLNFHFLMNIHVASVICFGNYEHLNQKELKKV